MATRSPFYISSDSESDQKLETSFADRQKQREEIYKSLCGDEWLTDGTIFDYLALKLPDVLVLDPVVFRSNYDVDTKGLIASRPDTGCGFVIMPVNVDDHWLMVALVLRSGIAAVFDTLRKELTEEMTDRIQKIADLLVKIAPNEEEDRPEDAVLVYADDESYAMQFDTNNCGPLICMIACALYVNNSLLFSVEDIKNWREEAFQYLTSEDTNVSSFRIRP